MGWSGGRRGYSRPEHTTSVAAWNFVENVTVANTYFEITWSSPDTLITLESSAANTGPTRPGIPSVIVTVTPVGA